MKIFVSIFMILALVVTTTMPSAHARPHDTAKAAPTQEATKDHDCHGHGAKADDNKAVQNDKDGSDKCCDKGMCKCVGGNCHNLSKYLGNGGNSLASLSSGSSAFALDNQFVDSALPNRLKRPPRA